jgi:hypothetical protein
MHILELMLNKKNNMLLNKLTLKIKSKMKNNTSSMKLNSFSNLIILILYHIETLSLIEMVFLI